MDFQSEFTPVYAHHDLLIEIGKVEMAMEYLDQQAPVQQQPLRTRLETRMSHLRSELDRLAN